MGEYPIVTIHHATTPYRTGDVMSRKPSKKLLAALIALGWCGSAVFGAAPATPQGTISAKGFLDIGSGTAITDLTGNAKFPDNPDVKYYYTYFEWNATGDIGTAANNAYADNYGAQMQGYFYPPSTGDYIFWICSDDTSQLFLSTDDDPANKKLIAQEGGWSNPRIWDSASSGDAATKNSSTFVSTQWGTKDPANGGAKITLTKGKPYYVEVLFKEGGGGDNVAVAVQDPGGTIDATLPIPGEYLSPFSTSAGAQILSQPVDRYVLVGGIATFSVGLDVPPSVTVSGYKWTKNGTDIPDSNATSISIKAVAADDGAKIKAIVTTSAGTLTSDEVTLYVSPFTTDYTPGIVKMDIYTDISGTTVDNLVSSDKFLAGTPDDIRMLDTLSTPSAYAENYGAKVSGFLIPTESGQYRFFLYSDDASEFWLSPDDREANAVKIAEETDCCDTFVEPDTLNDDGVTSTTSEPQALVAGKKYAFFAYLKEGTGGDYLQIATRKEGDTTAAGSLPLISSSWIGGNIRPTTGTPEITVQPTAPSQIELGRDLTLTVDGVVNPTGFNFPVIVKWQKDGSDIANALGKSYTIVNAKATDSGTYRAVVSAPNGNSVNSTEVAITVVSDISPPTILSAEGSPKHDQVTVHFSEPVESTSATTLANYSIDGGLTLSSPVLKNKQDVVFTTPKQTQGTQYTITVNNVKDLFNNVIAANTKVVFLPATVASGVAAYWNFDGNLLDSVNDFHGTARGTAPLTYVAGKAGLGQALKLDGADQCVEITGGDSANNLAFAGGSVSIAGWFKVGAFDTSWQCLIARGEGSSWRVARNNASDAMSYAGGLTDALGAVPVMDENWHHFVAITDQTAEKFGTALYIDGNLDGTIEGTPVLTKNSTQNVIIGDNPDARSREWNGELDEIAIWGRVLTEEEIAILFNNGAGKPLSDFLPPPLDLAEGLKAYWNFDGTLYDSVKNFHGTARGTNALAYVDGKSGFGKAIKLDGTDQFVEITGGDENELEFPGGSMSIAGWFKVDAFDTAWQCLLSKGEGENYRIARRSEGNAIAYAGGVGEGADDVPSVNDGKWHHFVAISDANTNAFGTAMYVDGVLRAKNAAKPVLASSALPLMIGENPGSRGREWEGEIDDIAIWNRVLSEAEVAALYNSGTGTPLSTLAGITGPIVTSITRSGNDIVIGWSPAGGTLEFTASLGPTASWTTVGTANPATISIGSGGGYYRVRK